MVLFRFNINFTSAFEYSFCTLYRRYVYPFEYLNLKRSSLGIKWNFVNGKNTFFCVYIFIFYPNSTQLYTLFQIEYTYKKCIPFFWVDKNFRYTLSRHINLYTEMYTLKSVYIFIVYANYSPGSGDSKSGKIPSSGEGRLARKSTIAWYFWPICCIFKKRPK